jgi:hypothetical protein
MRRVWADHTESTVKGCEENPGDYEDVVEVTAEWETRKCLTSGTISLSTLLRGELSCQQTAGTAPPSEVPVVCQLCLVHLAPKYEVSNLLEHLVSNLYQSLRFPRCLSELFTVDAVV